MRDPYDVLGVPRGASEQQVKTAYRALAKKYHPDNYTDSPLQDAANEKMQEINEAYDAIISGAANGGFNDYAGNQNYGSSSSGYGYSADYSRYGYAGSVNDYTYVRNLIDKNRLDDAEILLEQMDPSSRDAQWYFLKGRINYNRGWVDNAYTYFSTACTMDPNNPEYRNIYENIRNERNGGFKTSRKSSNSDCTSLCCGALCADSCCECMGGDLIPCC
ncbi:MAG: DnaJ domain-containing protein [Acutalibacteraceae bacterium]